MLCYVMSCHVMSFYVMAGGMAAGPAGNKRYPGRTTPFVILTCIVAASGGALFGYGLLSTGSIICTVSQKYGGAERSGRFADNGVTGGHSLSAA